MKANVATVENSKHDDRAIPNRNFFGSASIHFLEDITKSNSAMGNG